MDSAGVYPGANGASKDPHAWFNLMPEFMAQKPLSNYTANATGNPRINATLIPFPGGSMKIWECPAARMSDSDLMAVTGGGVDGFFSYVFNIDLKWQTISDRMLYPRMPKLSNLDKVTSTVLMTDSVFSSDEGFTSGNLFYSVNPAARYTAFPNRHNKQGGILAFCDGHAAYFKRAKINTGGSGATGEPLLPDVVWNPPWRLANP
jgi:prepilin-type processing-associated H-X9-DG protein